MKIELAFDKRDVARVQTLVSDMKSHKLVTDRYRKNVKMPRRRLQRRTFWYHLVSARLTSQQRSGQDSPVSRFITTSPFPLRYSALQGKVNVESLIERAIKQAGGIRFHNRISEDLAANFETLESGNWNELLSQCSRLYADSTPAVEREVAAYMQIYKGIGPKQSRNLLQSLGLTRYEIPIDSRLTNWLKKEGTDTPLSAKVLSDNDYYDLVSDYIQSLCEECGVLPCIFDASVFALKET